MTNYQLSLSVSTCFGPGFDAGLAVEFKKHWSAELKGAVFGGTGPFVDRNLVWASLRFQY